MGLRRAFLDDVVVACEDGAPLNPGAVTRRSTELTQAAELRSIRQHDLRHGQASLLLAAGVDIAVVSKWLGHSSIKITSDAYSHLLNGAGRAAANAGMGLVQRASVSTAPESVSNP